MALDLKEVSGVPYWKARGADTWNPFSISGSIKYYAIASANALSHGTQLTINETNIPWVTEKKSVSIQETATYYIWYMVYGNNSSYGIGFSPYVNGTRKHNSELPCATPLFGKLTLELNSGDTLTFKAYTGNNQGQKMSTRLFLVKSN